MMNQPNEGVDSGSLAWGAIIGFVLGGVVALFLSPRSGAETRQQISATGQELREQLEEVVIPPDPLDESMAEGKAAARRRRAELGFGK
jgi:gas vesicle protein